MSTTTPPTDQSFAGLLTRIFTREGEHPFETVTWEQRSARIQDETGKAFFEQVGIEVPAAFSELATKILASKYFYGDVEGGANPASGGREHSFKQVLQRVGGTLARWGLEDGYFANEAEARIFEEELIWLCLHQVGAFNSPVWFNLGLGPAYGVKADGGRGHFYWDRQHDVVVQAEDPYEYPQCSACFIQGVEDSMESIMSLAKSEAMLFKYGSGSGTDLSSLRSTREKLSGGGRPSGPISFLSVFDAVAGVVKSGGKTRRAAKMNVLKDWHPDIAEFIEAKPAEERKAWALIEEGFDPSFNGEAYASIKFQNENLSVRASDAFMRAADRGEEWWTRRVTDGQPCEKKNAGELLSAIAAGTHLCGDPGMQFDDNIHRWHTCKGSGRQNCTNPCSEYLFLDNSACNLASLNLMAFRKPEGFDYERFAAACRVFIIAQDIIVDRSSYPTEAIAYNSHWFRPLGLGYANLGALLMSYGHGYDSPEGREMARAITAVMTGAAHRTSIDLAEAKEPFAGYRDARHFGVNQPPAPDNERSMLEVIGLHRAEAEKMETQNPGGLTTFAGKLWREVEKRGRQSGFRNAQVTVLAPTGTIGFLMDCDTTGIEPAIGLVAYKQLAGGGMLTLPLQSIPMALKNLGYTKEEIGHLCAHIKEYGTLEDVKRGDKVAESGLKDEHLPIFDTAFRSGMGSRSLGWRAHIGMMAAVQPFLSGGISKTVNMPEEATVADIREVYLEAWRLGVKGVAIYRDGSKRSAPISTRKKEAKPAEKVVQLVTEPYRRRLPDTRRSLTHKFSIGGTEGYLTIGQFEDGSPGEVFIQMAKAGSTINGLMDTIGTLLSLSLQYGVPLETVVRKFSHSRFEPEGLTRNPDIPFAKSVVDYVARFLGMEYIAGYREQMSPSLIPPGETITKGDHDDEETGPPSRLSPSQLELLTQSQGNLTCPECGSSNVKVTGTCACCLNCGTSLGCS